MSRNEARRQKKLAKRRRKQHEKRLETRRRQGVGLRQLLQRFSRGRIVDSLISTSIAEQGIANVLLSREAGQGQIAVALFLVDRYCLGVKNAVAFMVAEARYSELLQSFGEEGLRKITPESARRLVEESVEFARGLGFPPHSEYAIARLIFGEIDPQLAHERFEMGRKGKPFYISGPEDSPVRARVIVQTLERTCGAGNYDYLCPGGAGPPMPHFLDAEWLDGDAEEEWEELEQDSDDWEDPTSEPPRPS